MHPESTFRHIWTILCFFGITFNAFSVPTAVAFMFSGRYSILVPALIVDLFFIVDIILNLTCFTYYDSSSGVVETRANFIRMRYMDSNSFKIDIIAALPLDVFSLAAPDLETSLLILPLLRLVKIVRVSHLYEYFENMESLVVERSQCCTTACDVSSACIFFLLSCCTGLHVDGTSQANSEGWAFLQLDPERPRQPKS